MGIVGAGGVLEAARPVAAMVVVELVFSAMQIFIKLALDDGMDVRVLVAYRPMFGAAFLCPVAFLVERKKRPPLTVKVVTGLFLCGLFGITMNQNLLVLAMKLTNSTTIVTALSNLTPQATFIVAILTRMETLKLRKPSGQAKLAGTLVGLGGAMLLTFYKGPEMRFLHRLAHTGMSHASGGRPQPAVGSRILGSFLAIAGCFSYAIWLTVQAKVVQVYPCHYSIAALVCVFGAAQSTLLTLCIHRDAGHWRLGLNIRLYSSAYAGIVASGCAFPLMSWCLQKKGPLYVAMFGPLIVVFVAVMSSVVLNEALHIGIVLGAVLIVAGLYMVLWGKAKEEDEQEADAPKLTDKDDELGTFHRLTVKHNEENTTL
ncbi:WAT1-related protein At1g68170-like [Hordeum vulgare subsp. vulgare]|uniref:WAT1-related protein n=1 Tax=Hordeum vulgare subsp. vulgare TaxID=112509 RepID=A0A8I6YJ40_HORVV|nr:WAT1-related protein At1g68170-like [Hordeum vulgare subsp. vulgare]